MKSVLIPLSFGLCFFIVIFINFDKIKSFYEKQTDKSIKNISRSLFLLNIQFNVNSYKKNFYWICGALTVLCFLVFWGSPILALFFAIGLQILAWKIPGIFLKINVQKRIALIESKMIDALVLMANGIKAGLSVQQSMDRVTKNLTGPIQEEFEVILSKIRLGSNTEEALASMYDRVPSEDVQMFTSSIIILKETGGNMAETFDTTVFTIRERQKVGKKIEALTSQGRTQGVIMSAMPLVFLGLFAVMQPESTKLMFTKPLGWLLLSAIFALSAVGAIIMKRVSTINV